jgi:hypothetical protein
MRINGALPPRPVAESVRRRLPSQQEVEDKEVNWVGDKRLYLPSIGQVGDLLYSNTWEAVCTLKCPMRGISRRQSIMIDTCYISDGGEMINMKRGKN